MKPKLSNYITIKYTGCELGLIQSGNYDQSYYSFVGYCFVHLASTSDVGCILLHLQYTLEDEHSSTYQ